jgi:uncharacterized protein (TIGR02265 family)
MPGTSSAPPSQATAKQLDLEQRLAVLTPTDTTRGFLFNAALELVKGDVGEDALKRCHEASGGLGFTAFFSYPVGTLLKLVYAAAHELSGRYGGFDEALRQLGDRGAPRFLESATGKRLLAQVDTEPRRLVDSLPTAYRMAWDHGTCSLTWTGPRSGRVSYENAMPVAYFAGSVSRMLTAARLTGPRVTGRQVGLTACAVDFAWE